ncbi:MAG: hypothetical protein KC503_10515 [Myxococcales bacterium]|nr:hypothetical protein [Myxococcales bacterium]
MPRSQHTARAVVAVFGAALLYTLLVAGCGPLEQDEIGPDTAGARSSLSQPPPRQVHVKPQAGALEHQLDHARVDEATLRQQQQPPTYEGPNLGSAECGGATCAADERARCVTVSYGPIIVCGCEVGGYRFICR